MSLYAELARAPEADHIAQGSKTGPLCLGLLRVRPFQQSPHKGRSTPRKIRSLRPKPLEWKDFRGWTNKNPVNT